MAKRDQSKPGLEINPLQNISGIAYDMELQIADAIGIARTARERCTDMDYEEAACEDTLGLILYRLEQIQEGHALIVKNAPFRNHVPGVKE